LAGAARQPLFSVIMSLSIYVCPQIFAAANGCRGRATPTAWRSVSTNSVRTDCGCTQSVPAHCVDVTSMSPIIIYPLCCEDMSPTLTYEVEQRQPERLPTCYSYHSLKCTNVVGKIMSRNVTLSSS